MFTRDKPSIKDKQALFAKILNMQKRLKELNTGYEDDQFWQLLYCVCVRYIRKAALETSAMLSHTETERVLVRAFEHKNEEADAECEVVN